jgi:transposase
MLARRCCGCDGSLILWFRDFTPEAGMPGDELFDDLPETGPRPGREEGMGRPRLREPEREQVELRAVDLDSVIGRDHPVRVIWAYVDGLDLSELENAIKSREGRPGHPAISPRLVLGLWLYATSQGVGSARALARLCESDDAYRWLCGGVSVNHHTLADARVEHGDLLDRLLAENVAALVSAGVIDLSALAQDGVKVRAAAGAASFRRRATLDRLAAARAVVDRLKREVHADPAASNARIRAAHERAARERLARIDAARAELGRVEAARKAKEKTTSGQSKEKPSAEPPDDAPEPPRPEAQKTREAQKQKPGEPRASTTDPQARVMKMADGGFRPAYNVQVVSAAGSQIVITVEPVAVGSDRGLIRPAVEEVRRRFGRVPEHHLADGGFTAAKDIEWAHDQGIAVHAPPTRSKHGTDPFSPRRDDGPGVLAWRARMASPEGQAVYKTRAICECIHGRWRNWNLTRFTVRGLAKVRAVMLWHALANNILQAASSKAAAVAG